MREALLEVEPGRGEEAEGFVALRRRRIFTLLHHQAHQPEADGEERADRDEHDRVVLLRVLDQEPREEHPVGEAAVSENLTGDEPGRHLGHAPHVQRTFGKLRECFREAAKQPRFKGILQAVDEPLVSIDYKGDPHSSSVDLPFTMMLGKEKSNFAKIVAWYDNEWGYSCRVGDLIKLMLKKGI